MTTIPPRQYKNNIAAFAKLNRLFKMPTVVLGEENDYYGTFLPEIAIVDHDVRRYSRTQISGFVPELREWLAQSGRKDVIIGGISIDNCVLHTALDLLRAGYNVFVVTDVSGTNSELAERTAIMRMRDAGAVMTGWLGIATELGVDFASQYGDGLKEIIGTHWPASTTGHVEDTTPDGHGMQAA
jgi:nicotinamidase-related amidase